MTDSAVARQCAERMYENDAASRLLGIRIEVEEAGQAVATLEIGENMINGFGVCHGGYLFTLADTAFAFACNGHNRVTFAAGASIDFLRPARLGDTLVAKARERHRGRVTGIYDVVVRNQDGKTVAIFRGRSHRTEERVLPGGEGASGPS